MQNIADTLLTFEGSYACYTNDPSCPDGEAYAPPSWSSTDPQKIFHIVYGIPEASLANASALTKQNNAGFVFLTTAQLADNPYATLPDFFAQEVADGGPGGGVDPTTPTSPGQLATQTVSDTWAILTWGASTDASGSGVEAYDIYQSGALITSVPASSSPQAIITGLYPSSTYSFTIAARSIAGKVSAPSVTFLVPWGFHHVYIDADDNSATGYVFGWETPSLGADYLIENDRLLYHTGGAGSFSWSLVATEEPVITGSAATGLTYTWTIPASDFNGGTPVGATSLFLVQADGYADEVYAPIVTVTQQ